MRRLLLPFLLVLTLVACESGTLAEFWRPISEPNILMPIEQAQKKLDFDLSQCHCGIYPTNLTHDNAVGFQSDKQRLAETGITVTPDEKGQCHLQPSLVVTECMRGRGWEITRCSGRMSLPGGGSLCAESKLD